MLNEIELRELDATRRAHEAVTAFDRKLAARTQAKVDTGMDEAAARAAARVELRDEAPSSTEFFDAIRYDVLTRRAEQRAHNTLSNVRGEYLR